jgi:glycosyltransferase involved in cell wall biosynthesis
VSRLKTVLFFRHYERFAGHHLKVFDYFNHVLAAPGHTALIRFSKDSTLDEANPWRALEDQVVHTGEPVQADSYFFSGLDWQELPRDQRRDPHVPVINYVQSIRHSWPDNLRYPLLRNRAIRICVSPEVSEAIAATGLVRGPVFTIQAAIDVAGVQALVSRDERDTDLAIFALKEPELGRSLAGRFARAGRTIRLIDRFVPRTELLDTFARSRVTLFLLHREEGKPLPPLEGMALGTVVVCPDVVGNRSFCLPGVNSFRPRYEVETILAATETALGDWKDLGELIAAAERTVHDHDLPTERQAFLEILGNLDELWLEFDSP